jgi:GNAT superfamily N-acetyltransferase
MPTRVKIRDAAAGDFDQWLSLWEGYNAFYKRAGPTAVSMAVTKTTWSRFFDHHEPMHCLIAETLNGLVGMTHYLYHRNTTMIGPTCYLQDLFTSEQARGKGVGRALIEGVYGKARIAGVTRVYWQTHETNVTAQRLYNVLADRPGFVLYRKDL